MTHRSVTDAELASRTTLAHASFANECAQAIRVGRLISWGIGRIAVIAVHGGLAMKWV
jgi:hypothetical protein